MALATYQVYLVEFPLEDEQARVALAKRFGIDDESLGLLLRDLPYCVKRDLNRKQAEQYQRALEELGATCRIQRVVPKEDKPKEEPVSKEENQESKTPFWQILLADKKVRYLAIGLVCALLWFVFGPEKVAGLRIRHLGSDHPRAVLILLHGYGAPGDDLVLLGEHMYEAGLPKDVRIIIPEAPQRVGLGRRAWWTSDATLFDTQAKIRKLVLDTIDIYKLKENQLFIAGFSQGAMLSLDTSARQAEHIGCAGLISGQQMSGWEYGLPKMTHMRVLLSHGRNDSVIPFSASTHIHQSMLQAGVNAELLAFDGGHQIPPQVRRRMAEFFRECAELD